MTLTEKILIVAEAMAQQRPIWLDGVKQAPMELTVMPCDNPSIHIRTSNNDCSLEGVEVSATAPAVEAITLLLSDERLAELRGMHQGGIGLVERDLACALWELQERRASEAADHFPDVTKMVADHIGDVTEMVCQCGHEYGEHDEGDTCLHGFGSKRYCKCSRFRPKQKGGRDE